MICGNSLKKILPFAILTANADAESRCSSSCIWWSLFFVIPLGGATIELEPDPVEVVSEMEDPEEKGGKLRSEGDGDEGAAG